ATTWADADLAHPLADLAGFLHLGEEALDLIGIAHCRTTTSAAPDGGNEGTDFEAKAGDMIGNALDVVPAGIDGNMRVGEPEIDTIELLTVGFGAGGQG